ncbi:MAG: amidohydrolase family protein, partial [Acidobacteria bacterium]|nr:amidohydrolase family protein [Acidobacteriota bacterium]
MASDRREFLKDVVAAAGLVFVGCGLDGADVARGFQPSGPARRRVMVKGKRIKIVDVHAHCAIPKATALMRRPAATAGGDGPLVLDGRTLADRLGVMDAQGIDVAVLSINPNWYDVDRDLAAQVISIQNESLAEFCTSHADRFVAFASVALQFPDLAAQQLERGMKTMGFRGAAIGGSVAGLELADPKFHPFWAKAEELGVLIFIHPQSTPDLKRRLGGQGWLENTIGNPLDTTIALSHLIFEGTLDRFPRLKICSA